MTTALIAPHGGALVDRIVADAGALTRRSATLPRAILDTLELADLELVATGAASPLVGFATSEDYESILTYGRLASGVVWPIPFTLAIADDVRAEIGGELALFDATSRLWGVLTITSVFTRDTPRELDVVYGTRDPAHPGVAETLAHPTRLVGGPVDVLPLPANRPLARYRKTPRELRAEIEERGWRRVAGFHTDQPLHRAHEHLTKLALEVTDGIVIHPAVIETKSDDVPASIRFATYEAVLGHYYPRDRTILAGFPGARRFAGPKQALLHALVRKNYGIGQLVVGPDHAGTGTFYPPRAAQEVFAKFPKLDLGVAPLLLDAAFYCETCASFASARTCPHDPAERRELSRLKLRETLEAGGDIPGALVRPEVAAILRAHFAKTTAITVTNVAPTGGFILWFTGLSGAGKSTLANAVAAELRSAHRIEILDGDEVRTHLSKGLGFSREDRDTNVHRIGFVARTLAQHGVGVITAAISPYAETRAAVRARAEERGVAFVEVFAHSSIEALVARDVKGLYKRALAGEVAHFTGISDPYEVPATPDVRVETDRETIAQSTAKIIAALRAHGLLAPLPLTAPGTSARPRAGA